MCFKYLEARRISSIVFLLEFFSSSRLLDKSFAASVAFNLTAQRPLRRDFIFVCCFLAPVPAFEVDGSSTSLMANIFNVVEVMQIFASQRTIFFFFS